MPYSLTYNPQKYEEVEKYLSHLSEIEEGKALVIQTSSQEELDKLTWLFYDYLHLIGATSLYSIKKVFYNLCIGKKKPSLSNLVNATPKTLTQEVDDILQTLIASPAPRKKIIELVESRNYSWTSLGLLLLEYSRVMGE